MEWNCALCTFENRVTSTSCEICGAQRAVRGAKVCLYYGTDEGCRNGEACRNVHKDIAVRKDFDSDIDYAEWVKLHCKEGTVVRMIREYEKVGVGDIGIFVKSNQSTPPAQFAWQGLSDHYWVWWSDVEILESPCASISGSTSQEVSEQVRASRAHSLDEVEIWPPPGLVDVASANKTWATQAIKFVEAHEVEFRRIAELSRFELSIYGLRFCDGGLEIERDRVRQKIFSAWEQLSWRLSGPIDMIWNGERDFSRLTFGCDEADVVAIKAIMYLLSIMERKLDESGLRLPWTRGHPRKINVYEPIEGSFASQGSTLTIKWITKPGADVPFVKIRLWQRVSGDNSKLKYIKTLARKVENVELFQWKIPFSIHTNNCYKITVTSIHDETIEDQSGHFTVNEGQQQPTSIEQHAPRTSVFENLSSLSELLPVTTPVKPIAEPPKTEEKVQDEAQDDGCIVCFDAPVEATFVHGDTGHHIACMRCAQLIMQRDKLCPFCRKVCDTVIRSFSK
eukprot:m.54517 g.54517  ORF g.54517 m.54517 type:complete len:508 (-) comp10933_c0_seq2:1021-2544(-)